MPLKDDFAHVEPTTTTLRPSLLVPFSLLCSTHQDYFSYQLTQYDIGIGERNIEGDALKADLTVECSDVSVALETLAPAMSKDSASTYLL